jgi:hypothetical protein
VKVILPAEDENFLAGRDFVRRKRNVFCQDEIFSPKQKGLSMAVAQRKNWGICSREVYIPTTKNNFPTPSADQPSLQTGLNDVFAGPRSCIRLASHI